VALQKQTSGSVRALTVSSRSARARERATIARASSPSALSDAEWSDPPSAPSARPPSDAALEAADVVITDDNLTGISRVLKTAKLTKSVAMENIVCSIGIKIAIIIFSLAGFAALWHAILADVGVALLATLNSFRALKA
jgi:hypothetical protein